MRGIKNLKNQNVFAKARMLSKGVLIFAWENGEIAYTQMADTCAGLAKKYLGVPVTIVTNKDDFVPKYADTVIVQESPAPSGTRDFNNAIIPWTNGNRGSAYELTPYDQTLLIDADFYMFNDSLKQLFDTDLEFACYDEIVDVFGGSLEQGHRRLGPQSITMQWATVIYFTKNELAEGIFDFMGKIKDNWDFYKMLYGFHGYMYRNDFALSIALQSVTGFTNQNFSRIPGKLFTADLDTYVYHIDTDTKAVMSSASQMRFVQDTNIHFFNKRDLVRIEIQDNCRAIINA